MVGLLQVFVSFLVAAEPCQRQALYHIFLDSLVSAGEICRQGEVQYRERFLIELPIGENLRFEYAKLPCPLDTLPRISIAPRFGLLLRFDQVTSDHRQARLLVVFSRIRLPPAVATGQCQEDKYD